MSDKTDKQLRKDARKAEKKRKRISEGGDHDEAPSKTRVVEDNSSLLKIQHLQADRASGPVIATPVGSELPRDIEFKTFSRPKGEASNSGSELLLYSDDHPKIDYVARQNQDVGAEEALKHYVGVFDPTTKQLQLVEARKVTVRNTLRAEDHLAQAQNLEEIAQVGESMRTLRHDLGMTFGTKKAKKAISSISENAIAPRRNGEVVDAEAVRKAIKADPAQAAILESMAAAVTAAPSQASTQAAIDEAKPRPKANEKAERPEDVYPISTIVGDETMKEVKVKPWVDTVESGEPVRTSSRFVSNRIEDLVNNEAIKELKILRYMYVLIKFYQALQPAGKSGKKLPMRERMEKAMGEEAAFLDTVKRRFTNQGYVAGRCWGIFSALTSYLPET
jgi:DNA-directed RNA polymerase I subunit RPA49